ncbi:GNAT family N-acetyltransferase [Haloarcula onubensis]|uniref:GNAT family N-acetyltransferase n=1 Tax=Haloarcula onubensis TaxID=2950539 RepID=A0ABU2FV15_9EURY|nr:GNAT family N-acetyltransferase [Halomicroarcula sp. S3CR25-11]MDS0284600.1 GNAT family N-acetyltransferase [Halomicroarcula sp. S3CR25-11]
MEIRDATPPDSTRIERIAESSFQSSFALSPEEIATLVDERFSEEALTARLSDSDGWFLVAEAEVDGETILGGFLDGTPGGRIRWLHVDPEARGQGIATALVEHVRDAHDDRPLAWEVLEDAVEGHGFCERFGLTEERRDRVEIGGHEFGVTRYTEGNRSDEPNEPAVRVPETVTAGGEARLLDRDDRIPGREAPFFRTFTSFDRESAYGYFCSQCGSTDVTADGLDRLECADCGNVHLADEWDGGYL